MKMQVDVSEHTHRLFKTLCALDGVTVQDRLMGMVNAFLQERVDDIAAIEKRKGKS